MIWFTRWVRAFSTTNRLIHSSSGLLAVSFGCRICIECFCLFILTYYIDGHALASVWIETTRSTRSRSSRDVALSRACGLKRRRGGFRGWQGGRALASVWIETCTAIPRLGRARVALSRACGLKQQAGKEGGVVVGHALHGRVGRNADATYYKFSISRHALHGRVGRNDTPARAISRHRRHALRGRVGRNSW